MTTGDFDPDRMLAAFDEAGVRFVLVGGIAAILHGDVGVTVDLDLVPERNEGNLERLARVLRTLQARVRAPGAPEGLAFDCSIEFLRGLPEESMLNLTTSAGDLDLTFQPSGTRGYADLRRGAVEIEIADGVRILVASLADIIRSKEAADREKDRLALPRLRRLLDRISRGDDEEVRG
ncbi:MAG: hypothetical protein ACYTGC_12935 [Planctomycetota bacterium]|jgi:hypothetical protein